MQHEIEILLSCQGIENVSNELKEVVIGAWNFNANIVPNASSTEIIDESLCKWNGCGVNMPVRGVPGFNWTSDYMSFLHGPQEYGAIHFMTSQLMMPDGKCALNTKFRTIFLQGYMLLD